MLTDAQKEVQAQTQTNGIAPFLIGVDLSSLLFAITDLKEFFMSKFLITTEQLDVLTASVESVGAKVEAEALEIKANLQFVIDALKVPDVDLSAQIEALEAIKSGVDALSDVIVLEPPVVETPADVPVDTMPVEPDPEVSTEPAVL
jgi:hypothetical protein